MTGVWVTQLRGEDLPSMWAAPSIQQGPGQNDNGRSKPASTCKLYSAWSAASFAAAITCGIRLYLLQPFSADSHKQLSRQFPDQPHTGLHPCHKPSDNTSVYLSFQFYTCYMNLEVLLLGVHTLNTWNSGIANVPSRNNSQTSGKTQDLHRVALHSLMIQVYNTKGAIHFGRKPRDSINNIRVHSLKISNYWTNRNNYTKQIK